MDAWTQDLSLIKPLVDSLKQHDQSYSDMGSDYSVTALLQPPRIIQLGKRYGNQMQDLPVTHDWVVKALASFRGNAIHDRFERMLYRHMANSPDDGYLIERRLWDRIRGRKISGKFDCFHGGTLYDFKTTSVWKKIMGDHKQWEEQLNAYAYLLATTVNPPIIVDKLAIIAWYTDWIKTKVFDKGYPKTEVELITIENLWPREQQESFLHNRIDQHIANENLPDHLLTPCTKEEMWEKDAVYAVMDPKSPEKAKRLKPTKEEAEQYIDWAIKANKPNAKNWIIEFRAGGRIRCEEWCDYNMFCSQFHEYMESRPVV